MELEKDFSFRAQNLLMKKSKSSGVHHGGASCRYLCRECYKSTTTVTRRAGSRRDQAEILQFTAALPPLLTGTVYTNDFSNSYLISLFLKWSRFKPSLFGRFTEESVHCAWKAKQLGFISLGLQHCFSELVQLKWKGKYSQLWWYLFHTWLFWNVSQVLLQFPMQKSLSKGNCEEIPQSNTLLSS